MDIVRFKGGLGNQMFQYAFMLSLKSRGREVKADIGYYEQNPDKMKFCINQVFKDLEIDYADNSIFMEIDRRWKAVKSLSHKPFKSYEECFFWVEQEDALYDERVYCVKDCAYVGYWQTDRYFKGIRHILKEKFAFGDMEEPLKELSQKLSDGYTSVHIRRGDYLLYELFQGICTKDYYQRAMAYIQGKTENCKFVFFSDDTEWVKQNFKLDNSIIISKEMFNKYEDWYDLYLMSCCENNIIANSSFSWWAAWLNSNPHKMVIAPKEWLKGKNTPDIWCEGWIKM